MSNIVCGVRGRVWTCVNRKTPQKRKSVKNFVHDCSFSPYKGIQDSLGFWIPRRGLIYSGFPGTGFQYLSVELGFWIPIVRGTPEFGVFYQLPRDLYAKMAQTFHNIFYVLVACIHENTRGMPQHKIS